VTFYHCTTKAVAAAILRDCFRDGSGYYLTDHVHSGVWVSNVPLDMNEGASGDVPLELQTEMSESDLEQYEWIEEGKSYREWLIPAEIINTRMKISPTSGV
jgi:hypothetical protein